MLYVTVPLSVEGWDEEKQEFITPKEVVLQLEHSLVSISKWESKWHKSFIHSKEKTDEEVVDYVKCMTLNKNIDSDVYNHLTQNNVHQIEQYIAAPMTATHFSKDEQKKTASREIVTSELIYYWMIALNIPFECQKWHINRLLTLIRVCNVKNQPPKKMSRKEIARRNHALNMARRNKLNTRG